MRIALGEYVHVYRKLSRPIVAAIFFSIFLPAGFITAGTIEGHVFLADSHTSPRNAHSPFARPHNASEEFNSHSRDKNEIVAVVYLAAHEGLKPVATGSRIPVVDQVDMQIRPHILPVQVGTEVEFRNSDDIYHNLFSLSPARKFDLGRYGKGNQKHVTFDKIGEVKVFCDIHPHMSSVILVLPNSYYGEVTSEHTYSIENVPPGSYEIHAWHEIFDESVRTVVVPEVGKVTVNFKLGH